MVQTPYAELHCHTNFSFLDGASAADDLVERAVELGLTGLAVTDHAGLYGAVRFVSAAEAVGLHPVVGLEIEMLDPAVPDPDGIVLGPRRPRRRGPRRPRDAADGRSLPDVSEGLPVRPRPPRTLLPGQRDPVKEDLRGIRDRTRGPHLVLLARSQ
ncbi:MAG: PHP domain-containing protein, partial [Candidatus Limnocylindrales bacterium]|nr:PHP domain-containing protein [Candidatus Limnocylindrales bacterium]